MGDLIRQLGAKVYDIQLLPFCPIRSSAERVNNNFAENILDSNGDTYERIIWCADVSGTYVCSADGLLSTTTGQRLSSTIQNKKIENETMFYRLCSPSYGSSYDYSNAKNEGTDYFIVDYYCKPINPYIHVAPHFKGLYGQSFGDARGLVCNENFSISQVSDAWINYELQNKNYQKIFNREIASMDKQIGWGIAESAIGAVAGTGQGAISGTMTGALTGGPVGAVAGAVTGGALSGVGGVLDVIKTVDLSLDNRDKAIAIHNMQLQNIRALPYSLSNVDSFTPNNKIFPIVEVYDCTAEEKTNLARYIAFNSMTINAYGTIEQYMSNQWSYQGIKSKGWIKARLLLTDYQNNNETAYLGDDAHIATAIAEELSKGVFIQ